MNRPTECLPKKTRGEGSLGWPTRVLAGALCVALASIGSSCSLDPVHRTAVSYLGPEEEELYPPESEYHRPGEPCALCHSAKGPGKRKFALGGTVFWVPDDYEARVANAYVRVLDANKTKRCFVTNCNGNFYVPADEYSTITFPLLVSVERTINPGVDESTLQIRRMSGHIGREASCATCHIQGLRDFASPGEIRLFDTVEQMSERLTEAYQNPNPPIVECPPPDDFVQEVACPEDRL